ncbi:hypothetical protein LXL04_007349 [Taraxacum kok-saghyz]
MIRGGKSLVSSPPAFSNDAKQLLVCTGNTVSIFSTATGLQVLELEGHTALVTSIIVVPPPTPTSKVLCNCWTTSLDGTIKYWDFSGPELIKTINIQLPIYSMVIPSLLAQQSQYPSDIYAYISVKSQQKKQMKDLNGQILKCNLSKSRLIRGVLLSESKKPEKITISSTGKYFGIHEKRKLRIWEVPAKDNKHSTHRKLKLSHTKNMTCVAFHPTDRIVAAGDETGRILIWRGFGDRTFNYNNNNLGNGNNDYDEENPGVRGDGDADSCTTWHWHSSQVKVLFFSSDGAYLYSGGKEGVLVVWQLDTGKKKFLPRIGTPLVHFTSSPDPCLSSISCADNRIHILKMPSMEILKSISGIKLPFSTPEILKKSTSNDFVFDQTAGLVAIRTENYCIQFYSLFDDREISQVQVCERNHQPSDDIMMVLNIVSLSFDGSLMGTVETKMSEEGIGGFVTLKFWERSHNLGFTLSTVIYEPHRDAGVSAVAFHPTRGMAVSASYGGDFKIWVSKGEDKTISRWACHAVGSYRKKPMTAAVFSSEGSILAVAADTVITLWDPEKNVLVAVIGSTHEPIVSLSFIGESDFLASASKGQLSVWSMSKLSGSWSYNLHTESIACSKKDSLLAVLVALPSQEIDKGAILLFNAENPVPIASWFVTKAKGGGIAFIKRNGPTGPSLLAYVNGDHEYVIFNPHNEEETQTYESKVRVADLEEETGHGGYVSMYGELPELKMKAIEASGEAIMVAGRPWETIFSGPSHTLPPLTKLCSVFLESLMEKRSGMVE